MRHARIWPVWRYWPIAAWDRLYRLVKRLDRPEAAIGPAFRLEVRRWRRDVHAAGRALIRRGDWAAVIHLDNRSVVRLHRRDVPGAADGLEFRRMVLASLGELARRAAPGGPLADVRGFAAVTLYHSGLARLGFEHAGGRPVSWVAAAYQRALVAWLFPAARPRVARRRRAERVWIARERLLALYGEPH